MCAWAGPGRRGGSRRPLPSQASWGLGQGVGGRGEPGMEPGLGLLVFTGSVFPSHFTVWPHPCLHLRPRGLASVAWRGAGAEPPQRESCRLWEGVKATEWTAGAELRCRQPSPIFEWKTARHHTSGKTEKLSHASPLGKSGAGQGRGGDLSLYS
jgi:hypothetical protein